MTKAAKLAAIIERLDDLAEGHATVMFGMVVWRMRDRRYEGGVAQTYRLGSTTYPYSQTVALLMSR